MPNLKMQDQRVASVETVFRGVETGTIEGIRGEEARFFLDRRTGVKKELHLMTASEVIERSGPSTFWEMHGVED